MNTPTTLQQRLKQARKWAKKSQKEVADAIGMAQSSYSQLEKGESKRTSYVVDIASFLGVDPEALNSGENWPDSKESYDDRKARIFAKIESLPEDEQEAIVAEIVARALRKNK